MVLPAIDVASTRGLPHMHSFQSDASSRVAITSAGVGAHVLEAKVPREPSEPDSVGSPNKLLLAKPNGVIRRYQSSREIIFYVVAFPAFPISPFQGAGRLAVRNKHYSMRMKSNAVWSHPLDESTAVMLPAREGNTDMSCAFLRTVSS